MENVIKIQVELKELVNKALEILQKNYNTEDDELDTPVSKLNMHLEDALWEISDLSEENLK
jgi:hypothetical protein